MQDPNEYPLAGSWFDIEDCPSFDWSYFDPKDHPFLDFDPIISDNDIPPYSSPETMPHTSRRTRFSKPKAKRAVEDLGDGWSRVEYAYRHDSAGSTTRVHMKMAPVDPDLTVEKMREEHERVKRKWVGSAHRKLVLEALEKKGPETWDVTKAVCIALGSLCLNWHARIRSVYQFAFFMDLLDIGVLGSFYMGSAMNAYTDNYSRTVKAKNKHEAVTVFVQEPRFTKLDHEFFKSIDVTVLEDPAAEAEVGDHTFFFAPHLEWNSEIPYLQEGVRAPLYVNASAVWIYEEAERSKEWGRDNKEGEQAMMAASALRTNHHEVKFSEDIIMEDSLAFTLYIIKEAEELEDDSADVKDLAASIEDLTI